MTKDEIYDEAIAAAHARYELPDRMRREREARAGYYFRAALAAARSEPIPVRQKRRTRAEERALILEADRVCAAAWCKVARKDWIIAR